MAPGSTVLPRMHPESRGLSTMGRPAAVTRSAVWLIRGPAAQPIVARDDTNLLDALLRLDVHECVFRRRSFGQRSGTTSEGATAAGLDLVRAAGRPDDGGGAAPTGRRDRGAVTSDSAGGLCRPLRRSALRRPRSRGRRKRTRTACPRASGFLRYRRTPAGRWYR
jgi:hypothetical protein